MPSLMVVVNSGNGRYVARCLNCGKQSNEGTKAWAFDIARFEGCNCAAKEA
jgi:hypothetical protein